MKEKATARVKVYPSTHKKLKVGAAKQGKTLAAHIEYLTTLKASSST